MAICIIVSKAPMVTHVWDRQHRQGMSFNRIIYGGQILPQ